MEFRNCRWISNYNRKNVGGKLNGLGGNGWEYRLHVSGLRITKHPEVLFSQVFVIWEWYWSPVSWAGDDTRPTLHRNAVYTLARGTSGAGCEQKQKQKQNFCSRSKGSLWMEKKCAFWTTVSKPLSIRPLPVPRIVLVNTPLTSLL